MNLQPGSIDYYEIRIEFLQRVLAHDPENHPVLMEIRDLQNRRRLSPAPPKPSIHLTEH